MPEEGRDTICISSQVGCPVNCRFCLTALMGLERNLTAGEIVGQVLFVMRAHRIIDSSGPAEHRDDGDGRAAAESCQRDESDAAADGSGGHRAFRRGGSRCRPSGIIPKIAELGREPVRPKLAISLNASTEEQRRELMPITRKYSLKDLLDACRRIRCGRGRS